MKKIAIILGILFIPTISSAAPSIGNVSGTFSHGNSITISGSGFGTKSPAKPFVWADFDGLSTGATPGKNSSLSASGDLAGNGGMVVTTADTPSSNSTKSVRAIDYDGSKNAPRINIEMRGATKVFVSMKRKWADSNWFNLLTNFKIFRLWPSDGHVEVDSVVDYQNYGDMDGKHVAYPGNGRMIMSNEGGTPSPAYSDTLRHPPANQWNIEEYQVSKSSLNTENGFFGMWVNGVKVFYQSAMNRTSAASASGFGSLSLESFWTQTGGYNGTDNPPLNGYVYWDDVYVDTTWSRVMIGNASTYNSCTHREPLIPTAWSEGSITAYFNQGSFPNGQSVYMFVVDSDGNASPGKTLTIGNAASKILLPSNSPNPPINIIIQ